MPPDHTIALAPIRTPASASAPARARSPLAALARLARGAPIAPVWLALALPLMMLPPLLARAQGPELKLPSFDDLQQKAVSSVNVTIGSFMLGLAGNLVEVHDGQTAELKKTLLGLKSVQVRSYRFNSDYVYSKSDVDAVRSQLSAPGWNRLVQTRDRNKSEAVDVYLAMDNHTITGVAIVVSDPREFTIVNVVGTVDVDQINKLRQTFEPNG